MSTSTPHGGHESTLLALNNTLYHWGALIVPPGYTSDRTAGNPYGASFFGTGPDEQALDAARYQGERLAQITAKLLG